MVDIDDPPPREGDGGCPLPRCDSEIRAEQESRLWIDRKYKQMVAEQNQAKVIKWIEKRYPEIATEIKQ